MILILILDVYKGYDSPEPVARFSYIIYSLNSPNGKFDFMPCDTTKFRKLPFAYAGNKTTSNLIF